MESNQGFGVVDASYVPEVADILQSTHAQAVGLAMYYRDMTAGMQERLDNLVRDRDASRAIVDWLESNMPKGSQALTISRYGGSDLELRMYDADSKVVLNEKGPTLTRLVLSAIQKEREQNQNGTNP